MTTSIQREWLFGTMRDPTGLDVGRTVVTKDAGLFDSRQGPPLRRQRSEEDIEHAKRLFKRRGMFATKPDGNGQKKKESRAKSPLEKIRLPSTGQVCYHPHINVIRARIAMSPYTTKYTADYSEEVLDLMDKTNLLSEKGAEGEYEISELPEDEINKRFEKIRTHIHPYSKVGKYKDPDPSVYKHRFAISPERLQAVREQKEAQRIKDEKEKRRKAIAHDDILQNASYDLHLAESFFSLNSDRVNIQQFLYDTDRVYLHLNETSTALPNSGAVKKPSSSTKIRASSAKVSTAGNVPTGPIGYNPWHEHESKSSPTTAPPKDELNLNLSPEQNGDSEKCCVFQDRDVVEDPIGPLYSTKQSMISAKRDSPHAMDDIERAYLRLGPPAIDPPAPDATAATEASVAAAATAYLNARPWSAARSGKSLAASIAAHLGPESNLNQEPLITTAICTETNTDLGQSGGNRSLEEPKDELVGISKEDCIDQPNVLTRVNSDLTVEVDNMHIEDNRNNSRMANASMESTRDNNMQLGQLSKEELVDSLSLFFLQKRSLRRTSLPAMLLREQKRSVLSLLDKGPVVLPMTPVAGPTFGIVPPLGQSDPSVGMFNHSDPALAPTKGPTSADKLRQTTARASGRVRPSSAIHAMTGPRKKAERRDRRFVPHQPRQRVDIF